VPTAIDYERLDRLFTAEGKFDWGGVPVSERKALHRHFDVVAIINAAHYEWRYSAGCRAKPKLFGEACSAAYAPGRVSVDKRTAVPDRIDEDVIDIARVRTVTGDPDWQPRVKPHSARQVIGCRHPLGMKHEAVAHLKAIADRARLAGHPIRFEEWLSWEAGVLLIGMRIVGPDDPLRAFALPSFFRPLRRSMRCEAAIDHERVPDHEACSGTAQPKNRGCNLFGPP
jgi:hypothetical protein